MNTNNDAKVNGAGDSRATRLSVTANDCPGDRNGLNLSVSLRLCGERDRK
jgi:hypothetical protein